MEYEKDILKAESGLKLDNATLSDVKKFYRQAKNYIGFPLPDTNEDLNDICKSIQQTFRNWRINEMLLAVQFSNNGLLPNKITTFGSPLTPLHLRDVMLDYARIKGETILKFKRPDDTEIKLPQSEKDRIMIEGIKRNYRNFLIDPGSLLNDNFFWHHYVNHLVRDGKLTYNEDDFNNALESSEAVMDIMPNKQLHSLLGRVIKGNEGNNKQQLRNKLAYYCLLLDYFSYARDNGIKTIYQ
jgi:hypothetical protein